MNQPRTDRAVGVIGLGRMGLPLCCNLQDSGYQVTGFDVSQDRRDKLCAVGMTTASSLSELCELLPAPRLVLLLVPAGEPTAAVITELLPGLKRGDIVIDAGNSHYRDSVSRAHLLAEYGIGFLDVGTSGGIQGARHGACLTIGGMRELFEQCEPLFKAIACPQGYLYVGPSGWGHLVKTIHNGIEYGFLQAIAEGLHTISTMAEEHKADIDLAALCRVWGHGSIISSRLVDDAASALEFLKHQQITGQIGGGETGRWAEGIARECGVATPVLSAALAQRERSRQFPDAGSRIIAAIRNVFGQHEVT